MIKCTTSTAVSDRAHYNKNKRPRSHCALLRLNIKVTIQNGGRAAAATHLMRAELGPVQAAQGVLHVLAAEELHHALAVTLHVGEAHVARLPHVVLQVLPAPGGGKPYRVAHHMAMWRGRSHHTNDPIELHLGLYALTHSLKGGAIHHQVWV